MPVVLPQAANKVMILCAGGTKIMKLCLSELEPSSVFGLRMKNALNRQSGSCVLTWACHEAILLKKYSVTDPEYVLVLREAIVWAVQVENCTGVLVLHDADTLCYIAASMSYLLSGIPASVIVTGALIPVNMPDSDVWENIDGAMMTFACGIPSGVHLYFHGDILRPLLSSRIKTAGRQPFWERDDIPCQVGASCRVLEVTYITPMKPVSIGVLPVFPGMGSSFLDCMLSSGIQSLVLEYDGTGEAFNLDVIGSLRRACSKGIVVVLILTCVGRSDYRVGDEINCAGVVSAGHVTREAILGKLYALIGSGLKYHQVRDFFECE